MNLFDESKMNKICEKLARRYCERMEEILEKVIRDNPEIHLSDMQLRFNCNHMPVDVITKDGRVLYDFKEDM